MNNIWRLTISISQIIGGISGIGLVVWQSIYILELYQIIFLVPVVIVVYAFTLVSGVLLLNKNYFGRITSIIVQIIQLPKIFSPFLLFTFSFGVDIYPYLMIQDGISNGGLAVRIFAFHNLLINMDNTPIGFGVSIPASIFLVVLFKKNHQTDK